MATLSRPMVAPGPVLPSVDLLPTATAAPNQVPPPESATWADAGLSTAADGTAPSGRTPGGAVSPGVTRVVWAVAAVVLFLLAFGITVLVADGHGVLPGS